MLSRCPRMAERPLQRLSGNCSRRAAPSEQAVVFHLVLIAGERQCDRYRLLADVQPEPAMLARERRDERSVTLSTGLLLFIAHEPFARVRLVPMEVGVNVSTLGLPRVHDDLRGIQHRLDLGL